MKNMVAFVANAAQGRRTCDGDGCDTTVDYIQWCDWGYSTTASQSPETTVLCPGCLEIMEQSTDRMNAQTARLNVKTARLNKAAIWMLFGAIIISILSIFLGS